MTRLLIGICLATIIFMGRGFAAEAGEMVNVQDFGAICADGVDDTAAVNEAIKYCLENKKKGIIFPKGRYEFWAPIDDDRGRMAVSISDANGLIIDGDGSELMFSGVTGCFSFSRCEDVTVRNLTVDWKRPLISCGEVVASGEKSFDVRAADEFPVNGTEKVEAFMDFDPVTRLPKPSGLDVYALDNPLKCELVSRQVLRVHVNESSQVPVKGSLVALRHRVYGWNGFAFSNCKDVRVEGVTIYFCLGMAFIGGRTENVTLENCKVMLKPDTERLVSATADGSHWGACDGTITIKDCLFEGMGDDAVNAKMGLYLTVLEKVDERTVVGKHNLGFGSRPDVGDIMELTVAETIEVFGTGTVSKVEAGEEQNTYKVTFAEVLPERLAVGNVLGNITHNPKLRISNVTVRRNRARGFLIQVHDAIVENCKFENVTSAGILLITETIYFYECGPARDVTIRNCEFVNCNYGAAQAFAPITVQTYVKGGTSDHPGVFKDIVIENNRIDGGHSGGIYLNCVENAVVRGNTVVNVCDDVMDRATGAAITLSACKDVVLENNTAKLEEQAEKCKQSLLIDEYSVRDTIKVRGNAGF